MPFHADKNETINEVINVGEIPLQRHWQDDRKRRPAQIHLFEILDDRPIDTGALAGTKNAVEVRNCVRQPFFIADFFDALSIIRFCARIG